MPEGVRGKKMPSLTVASRMLVQNREKYAIILSDGYFITMN